MRDSPQGLPSVSLIPGADGSPAQMLRLRALMAKKRKQTARKKTTKKARKGQKAAMRSVSVLPASVLDSENRKTRR